MDTHAAHRTPQVKEFASLLKVTLTFIRRDAPTNAGLFSIEKFSLFSNPMRSKHGVGTIINTRVQK
jgi:hypothetical protein